MEELFTNEVGEILAKQVNKDRKVKTETPHKSPTNKLVNQPSFKARIKASPKVRKVLTPLKKQATRSTLFALQLFSPVVTKSLSAIKDHESKENISITPRKKEPTPLWRDGAKQSIIDVLTKEELKRQELIFELIQTEEQYVKDLKLIVNSFLLPMNQIKSVTPQEIEQIFANIEDIISINEPFFRDLKQRQLKATVVEQIGDILSKYVSSFTPYGNYIGERAQGDHQLLLTSKNSDVATLLKECLQKEECRRLDLSNFLDQPRRRLSKYSCLLNEIDKSTAEDHPDRDALTIACQQFNEIITTIDEQAGEIINEFQLNQLKNNLIITDQKQANSDLLNDATLIIHRDCLKYTKENQPLTVFLLDTGVVMTKQKVKNGQVQYKLFKNIIPLSSISVVDLSEINSGAIKNLEATSIDPYSFRLTYHSTPVQNFVLTANSINAKTQWVQLLELKDEE